jgi:hypothetical protein
MKINRGWLKNQYLRFMKHCLLQMVTRMKASAGLKHSNDKEEGECNHHDGGHPGNRIEDKPIRMIHHQLFIIDNKKHEDEDEGENHSIEDLREIHDRDQREMRVKDDSCS